MKKFFKRLILGVLIALPWIGAASAQQVNMYWWNGTPGTSCPSCWIPVSPTNPFPTAPGSAVANFPETNANSTISITNTFQSALAASSTRKGCWIQNQGTHVMYIYASETNSPTLANSTQFSPGQQYICNGVGAVQITGTAGDAYQVVSQ